jgi:hypothetical protein
MDVHAIEFSRKMCIAKLVHDSPYGVLCTQSSCIPCKRGKKTYFDTTGLVVTVGRWRKDVSALRFPPRLVLNLQQLLCFLILHININGTTDHTGIVVSFQGLFKQTAMLLDHE